MEYGINQKTQDLLREYMPERATLKSLANFFSVLSDSTRIRILSALSISDMCVNDLTKMLDMNQTTVSHQLKTMRDMGFVDFTRQGKVLIYNISNRRIWNILLDAADII